jgi:hypothetical protein
MLNFLFLNFFGYWEMNGDLVFKKDEDADMFDLLKQQLIKSAEKVEAVIEKIEKNRQSILQKMKERKVKICQNGRSCGLLFLV